MHPLVVIPTYNESENVEELLTRVLDGLPDAHALVVDDNSPDHTGDVVEALSRKRYPGRVHLIRRAGKMGLGTAYIEGFRWALARDYDCVIQMDADLSHNPVYLSDLVRALDGFDLVLGSRYVPGGGVVGWSALRSFISRGGNLYARAVLGLPYRDLTGGYKCFRRRVLESIDLDTVRAKGYAFQIEMTWRALCKGFTVTEIPIVFADRVRGKSQFSWRIFLEALGIVWRLRRLRDDQA